ncbi:EamA family transporter [Streptomyces sp. CA-181903]|uniref:EamA family transporter n=1 Tax=Streptomyces sp. CA-181903 TaxID=3240055 RepID=UPI003D8F7BFE
MHLLRQRLRPAAAAVRGPRRRTAVGRGRLAAGAAVGWLGLGCTVLAFCTWSRVLRAATAATSSLVLYAVPVAALALDAALFGNVPAPLAGVGGLIVLLGVAVAATRRTKSRRVAGSGTRSGAARSSGTTASSGGTPPSAAGERTHGRRRVTAGR